MKEELSMKKLLAIILAALLMTGAAAAIALAWFGRIRCERRLIQSGD